jgi:hypothetical protein
MKKKSSANHQNNRPSVVSPLVKHQEAIQLLANSRGLLRRCEAYGWLTPVVRAKKCTLYRRDDVYEVIGRLSEGEYPGQRDW